MFHYTKCVTSLIFSNCLYQVKIFLTTATVLLCFKLVILQFYFCVLQSHICEKVLFPLVFWNIFSHEACVVLVISWLHNLNSVYLFCQKIELSSVGALISWPAFQVCWWHVLGDDLTPWLFGSVCSLLLSGRLRWHYTFFPKLTLIYSS